jgi:hypothetical protein
MGASLQLDLGAARDALHHSRLAAWAGPHRRRRSRHRQFRQRRRDKDGGEAKPKAETRNHPADPFIRRNLGLNPLPRGRVGQLFGGNTPARPETGAQIFVARQVGPFGPKAGSIRKLSFAVIAPSGKAPSGMTSVA